MFKRVIAIVAAVMLTMALCACTSTTVTLNNTASNSVTSSQGSEASKPQNLNIGDTVSNDKFKVTLTAARVDSKLSSDKSRTYWTAAEGAAYVILEFDVTALTSERLAVDDDAITDLVAHYKTDTYANWDLQYVHSEIWGYIKHTYLDANLPAHIYAHTFVPAEALNSGELYVTLKVNGTPYSISIRQ